MIDELILKRMELKNQIDKLTQEKEECDVRIKLYMEQNDLDNYRDSNGNFASYKQIITNRLDKQLVSERLSPQEFKECFKEIRSVRLIIMAPAEMERRSKFNENSKI